MTDLALHLVQRVISPTVRCATGYAACRGASGYCSATRRRLCAAVVSAFVKELSRSLKRRVKSPLELRSVADAHTGCVVSIQRTAGALRPNVHMHVLGLGGAYVRDAEECLRLHALPQPTRVDRWQRGPSHARSEVTSPVPLRGGPVPLAARAIRWRLLARATDRREQLGGYAANASASVRSSPSSGGGRPLGALVAGPSWLLHSC